MSRATVQRWAVVLKAVLCLAAGAGVVPAAATVHDVAYFPAHGGTVTGLLRIENRSDRDGEIAIEAWNEHGDHQRRVVLRLGALEAVRLTSAHLAAGHPGRGLDEGLGYGLGREWSFAISSDLALDVRAYARADRGLLVPIHDLVPEAEPGRWQVTVPHGARHPRRSGFVRIVNPGADPVEVSVDVRDDAGVVVPGPGPFLLGPREARWVRAEDFPIVGPESLRAGPEAGVGLRETGWWRVEVRAGAPLWVQGLVRARSRAVANVSTAAPGGASDRIHFVGCHRPEGFHGYLARGARAAGADLGAHVRYVYPEVLSAAAQIDLVDKAIEGGADAVVLCAYLPDAAYAPVLARAAGSGVAIGSAAGPRPSAGPRPDDDPFLFRVGADEREAGERSARRLLGEAPVRGGTVVILNHLPDDVTCRERADAQAEVLWRNGVRVERIERQLDEAGQEAALLNLFLRHPYPWGATSVCGPPDPVLRAKRSSGQLDLVVSGYDLLGETIEAIRDGRQAFAIDQQQFWRGYVPVMLAAHYLRYGLVQSNYFLTGPAVVDASNIERVAELVEAGYR